MREILFRGKRVDNGEWVYGNLLQNADAVAIQERKAVIHDMVESYAVIPYTFSVISDTVGQYTGMTDKNGKKIFEGDVLKIAKLMDGYGAYYFPPIEYPAYVVVHWDLCSWGWKTTGKDEYYTHFPDAWSYFECEVIGNIYDNPELVEGVEGRRSGLT